MLSVVNVTRYSYIVTDHLRFFCITVQIHIHEHEDKNRGQELYDNGCDNDDDYDDYYDMMIMMMM